MKYILKSHLQGDKRVIEKSINVMSKKLLVTGLCVFALAGCASSTVKQTFDLDDGNKTVISNSTNQKNKQIAVAPPDALLTLDSQNIVIRGGGGSIAYLDDAQWSDRLTNIVQMRLVEALENSDNFSGVGRTSDGLNANYQLLTEVREFSIVLQPQGKLAKVEIAAKVMDTKWGTIRKTHVFTNVQPVSGDKNADYAIALSRAFSAVLQDMAQWAG